jgi:hypothetical protein
MAIIMPVAIMKVTVTEKTMTHKMWYLQLPPKRKFTDDKWICDSGTFVNY